MYQIISSEFAEYKMGDFINNGQFSTVKSAMELRSGKNVAVKIVDKRNLSKLQIERLYIEMHILQQISHPHLIKLFDIIQTETHVYLITELMGQDLFEYLRMVGRVEEDRCKKIISQLLDAISYLHDNNIVHRDIKPENILLNLGNENSIVLADFGFAKYSNPDEEIETPCGTLQYIAPEIANNEKYKKSIDLWGVGVTLYLLLSGQPPFFSSDTNKLREKVLKGRVTFSPKRWNNISEDAKDFIKILLSKDPNKRPTAKEALKNKWFSKSSSPVLNHHSISIQRSQPKSIPLPNFDNMDTNEDLFSPPNKQRMIDVFSPENTPPQISNGNSSLLVKKVLDITFSFQQPEDFRNGTVDDSDNQIELGSVSNSSLFKKRTKK